MSRLRTRQSVSFISADVSPRKPSHDGSSCQPLEPIGSAVDHHHRRLCPETRKLQSWCLVKGKQLLASVWGLVTNAELPASTGHSDRVPCQVMYHNTSQPRGSDEKEHKKISLPVCRQSLPGLHNLFPLVPPNIHQLKSTYSNVPRVLSTDGMSVDPV